LHSAYNHKRATLQNAVSHTTEERMQLLPDTAVPCGGVTHCILQRWRAYDCTHCIIVFVTYHGASVILRRA
jgi:hypothetical protein